MKLTTTLAKIRACSPCSTGWKTLVTALGGIDAYGENAEINLLKILETNGVQDMLWCLRATNQDSKRTASELAIAFAEESLSIFEDKHPDDKRPRLAIQAAKEFNAGLIGVEELRTARRAAADATAAAAAADAYAAADAADAAAYATAAADAAAYATAAADAAYAAADAADAAYAAADARQKMKERQAEIIRMILE